MMLRTGAWNLSDLKDVHKNGLKVFSCFHCGGGSTMGYKLAGFDVIGGVEIDPEMMKVYRANHNPKHSYLMGVQEFNKIPRNELPEELLKLDILDGSPPCSSFSMAGSREKAWGTKKKFREGQSEQVLDDLFFQFIETARILQPKVVVAENVKGLVIGKAKGYVKQIFQMFNMAGYDCQLFLLNAAFMGVPQRRERTFFVARRKDLELPRIKLDFSEDTIALRDVVNQAEINGKQIKDQKTNHLYAMTKPGEDFRSTSEKVYGKRCVLKQKVNSLQPVHTQTASTRLVSDLGCFELSDIAVIRAQSFPDDFNFGTSDPLYLCGMSVPPFMMQRIAHQIHIQCFLKLGGTNG